MTIIMKLPSKKRSGSARPAASSAPRLRPRYSGGLSADELLRPGGKLLSMLVARANQLDMKLADMCHNELGCTYGYLFQMRTGVRHTANISDEFATRCALFLGVPRITVLMAAGRVTVEDYFERPKMAAAEISRAMQYVLEDPTYGVDMHPEVMDLHLSTQFAIVQLYEKATGRRLLGQTLSMDSLAEQLTQLDETVAKMKASLAAPGKASAAPPVAVPA